MTFSIVLLLLALVVYAVAIMDKPHRRTHSAAFVVVLLMIGTERHLALQRCLIERPDPHPAHTLARAPFIDPALVAELAHKYTNARIAQNGDGRTSRTTSQ